MVVLLTGFEPNDAGWNASQQLVESLGERPPIEAPWFSQIVRCAIMPGDTHRLEDALKAALDHHRPQLCLLIGQAPSRNRITLERFATNLKDFTFPDRTGNMPQGEAIVPGGPPAYVSTLPHLPRLVLALHREEIPAAISNHAGNHLCNQLLYLGLHLSADRDPAPSVGFVHIPILPYQVISEHRDGPSMPLEMLRRAIILILAELIGDNC